MLLRKWRKGDPRYVGTESLATLSPLLMWEVQNAPNEQGVLDKEMSRKVMKAFSGFFLMLNTKCEQR